MASISVQYNCGCGFRTHLLEAAAGHSDSTHHTMTVCGVIHPDESKLPKPPKLMKMAGRVSARPVEHVEVPEPVVPVVDSAAEFEALKNRLRRKK